MASDISNIKLDERSLIRSEKNKNARDRAITDLIEESDFKIENLISPYTIDVKIIENKLRLHITPIKNELPHLIEFSLSPFRRIVKDYHVICESYFDAINNSDPRKTEAIDMGRRGVHNEGAEIVEDMLSQKVNLDFETARKIFALIYVLQIK